MGDGASARDELCGFAIERTEGGGIGGDVMLPHEWPVHASQSLDAKCRAWTRSLAQPFAIGQLRPRGHLRPDRAIGDAILWR